VGVFTSVPGHSGEPAGGMLIETRVGIVPFDQLAHLSERPLGSFEITPLPRDVSEAQPRITKRFSDVAGQPVRFASHQSYNTTIIDLGGGELTKSFVQVSQAREGVEIVFYSNSSGLKRLAFEVRTKGFKCCLLYAKTLVHELKRRIVGGR
jgi:hypothetical protein